MLDKGQSEADLIALFGEMYRPHKCAYCAARDIFVCGPHAHHCSQCGQPAYRGLYTTPLCDDCWRRREAPDYLTKFGDA